MVAGAAAADTDTDIAEDAVLTWAEGPGENGARARMFAGDIDGRGVVYAEYYKGNRLWMSVPYTRVFIDHESESSPRTLRGLRMIGQTEHGFAFTAEQGTATLQCTALLWADASINCTRSKYFTPKGSASCAKYLQSHDERFQCNGLQQHFTTPAIAHEDLLALCAASFRGESDRTQCMRDGYNAPTRLFSDALATCTAAYRTSDERKLCMSFTVEGPEAQRIAPGVVRTCARANRGNDKAITDCAFLQHTGVEQEHPVPKIAAPTDSPTEPVAANATPRRRVLAGARIDVAVGKWRDLTVRATGGLVESEPVLWVDALANETLKWMQPVDRIVVGKRVIALREVSSLDRVKLAGDLLTFRAVLGGKRLDCRADVAAMFARCR